MRLVKKSFSVMLALLIAITVIPFAGSKNLKALTEYDVSVNGVIVNDDNKGDILGDGNVSYDPATQKLTIKNNAVITSDSKSGKGFNGTIVSEGDITISGKGTFYNPYGMGMLCKGNVTIEKDSEIAICGEIAGIYNVSGDLIVNGKLTLNSGDEKGVAALITNDIIIDGENAVLTGKGHHGIVCGESFQVKSGTVSINIPKPTSESYASFSQYYIFGDDIQLTKPEGGKFMQDGSAEIIVNPDGKTYATTIEIKKVEGSSKPAFDYKAEGTGDFADFIERLYNIALGRPSEADGKEYWLGTVKSGQNSGADCAKGFLFSEEFLNRGLSREQFVDILYMTFFKREADIEGKTFWLKKLAEEGSKQAVIEGFIDSNEWCDICASYGIRSGAITAKASFPSENAKAFAKALYTGCLGREAEEGGLNYWALSLTNQERSGYAAACEFFGSDEFKSQNFDNTEFLKRVYLTFMLREADTDGLNYWLGRMNNGTTREQVLAEFAYSKEFTELCNKYGILRGV